MSTLLLNSLSNAIVAAQDAVAAPVVVASSVESWDRLGMGLIQSVIYSILGIIILLAGYWILAKVVPFDLNKELSEDDNPAVGVFVAGLFVALGIVIHAAISG